MPINASLFGHIQNDAFLSGTSDLEGNDFSRTVNYLKDYIEHLSSHGESIPPEYNSLLTDLAYLLGINDKLNEISSKADAKIIIPRISAKIVEDALNLNNNQSLTLPGGWKNKDGGHAQIYQITRYKTGYLFTSYTTGGGLEYHHQKSSIQRELSNPRKQWFFPMPNTEKKKMELNFFLQGLLNARLPHWMQDKKKPITAKFLYLEILQKIYYLDAVEVDPNEHLPQFGYTGGQLSGTCSQRILHLLLKILSKSEQNYQQFIFKFKLYALNDYTSRCIDGFEPYTDAVKHQIYLAISNNLKILNTDGLFSLQEKEDYLNQLSALKNKLNLLELKSYPKSNLNSYHHELSIKGTLSTQTQQTPNPANTYLSYKEPITLKDNYVDNMEKALKHLLELKEAGDLHYHLESLILQLSKSITEAGFIDFLRRSPKSFEFQCQLYQLTEHFNTLQINRLENKQTPAISVLHLCLLHVVIKVHAINQLKKKQPYFIKFCYSMMRTFLSNHTRSPFFATTHPELDQQLLLLQGEYKDNEEVTHEELHEYYQGLINLHPDLCNELKSLYQQKYGQDNSRIHHNIRELRFEALFMISQHITNQVPLDETKFRPLLDIIRYQLSFESQLRTTINPFFDCKLTESPFRIDFIHEVLNIHSPLFPSYVEIQTLNGQLSKDKYILGESAAKSALTYDHPTVSRKVKEVKVRTANNIQLRSSATETQSTESITAKDIIARDYYHLRSIPSLQIPLTLDYFTRHLDRLGHENERSYVEANLLQPGLLINQCKEKQFLPQFDKFINEGLRYYMIHGQHSPESLFFLRLDFLVSRYATQLTNPKDISRLDKLQTNIEKHLALPNPPEIQYFLNEYLFLTLIAKTNAVGVKNDLFPAMLKAYFFIQSHSNPAYHEDFSHRIDLNKAIAQFKTIIAKQNAKQMESALQPILSTPELSQLTLKNNHPTYSLIDKQKKIIFDVIPSLGKLFSKNLARTGLPLTIKNHPLIKHLGLDAISTCLMSADSQLIQLKRDEYDVRLYYSNNNLTVQREWLYNKSKRQYELLALSKKHLAVQANATFTPVYTTLPKILIDGSMDYWKSLNDTTHGLLVQNNTPVYAINNNQFIQLNSKGEETPYRLVPNYGQWSDALKRFESLDFQVALESNDGFLFKLPRFNLTFTMSKKGNAPVLMHQDTGEKVVEDQKPIHDSVASLVLVQDKNIRCLVPVARFYALGKHDDPSALYRVDHDISCRIAKKNLKDHWKTRTLKHAPLWHYEQSEEYISFKLKNGQPVVDNVADGLYLAYLYLATDQPEKAWATLEECDTRWGGLTGNPKELEFISWIYNELPHVLPDKDTEYNRNKPKRSSPPYVACQLKAMSLLCDFLSHDKNMVLPKPKEACKTANDYAALLHYEQTNDFLIGLPHHIHTTYTRYQKMGRHLDSPYILSSLEKKRLLDFYHQAQPKNYKLHGAIGYEWTQLKKEKLQQQRSTLSTGKKSSSSSEQQINFIDEQLKNLNPIAAINTRLEPVYLDLDIPNKVKINTDIYSSQCLDRFYAWDMKNELPSYSDQDISNALSKLNSQISDDDFLTLFPILLDHAFKTANYRTSEVYHFCVQTFRATRHVPLVMQESNIPLLCNILYKIVCNKSFYQQAKTPLTESKKKLDLLLISLRTTPAPRIEVLEAKKHLNAILAYPGEITPQTSAPAIPLSIKPSSVVLIQDAIIYSMKIESKVVKQFKDLITRYHQLEVTTHTQLTDLEKAFGKSIDDEYALEDKAGDLLYTLESKKSDLAKEFYKDQDTQEALINEINRLIPIYDHKATNLWNKALELANLGPDNPMLAQTWKIDIASGRKTKLTKKDLMSIYTRADQTYSQEKTGLSAIKVDELHQIIHQALLTGIQQQMATRISASLVKAKSSNDAAPLKEALDLLSRKDIPGADKPAIVVLQHEQNIILRKRQDQAQKSLLTTHKENHTYDEIVEKVSLGGGKSKILTPILAEMKANGNNLVVVEVPEALLHTNHVDLNQLSQRLYGKRAHKFEFSRESNASPERLEQLYHFFTDIMVRREYLVTTDVSVQALELKYLELLLKDAPVDETWKKQVYWLDKITNLFHHQADNLMDEVHQALWIKKRLNYTLDDAQSIDNTRIDLAIQLYRMIEEIDPTLIKRAADFPKNHDWMPFKIQLANKLLSDTKSPLYQFITDAKSMYGDNIENELLDYLLGQAKSECKAVSNASKENKDKLSFLKQEISKRLERTLVKKVQKDYGRSKRPGLSPIDYTLAIPYVANEIPNEQSRFGHDIDAINYTIQMMLQKGISETLFIERITQWQALSRHELIQDPKLSSIEDTPTAKGFAIISGDETLPLNQIQTNNKEEMSILWKKLRFNRKLIYDTLQEQSLKLIKQESNIIHSDSFNHVDQYRSNQGVAGTPYNHTTYHQRLRYNRCTSLGTDGYLGRVIREKTLAVKTLDYQDCTQFVNDILTNSIARERCRAIIDINATFQSVPEGSLGVAKAIAHCIRNNPKQLNTPIKHVLFFDEHQVLCAFSIDTPEKIISLGTSDTDEINQRLDSTPEERFTFYDHGHKTGTDITQGEIAHALVLADDKNSFFDFLQGCARMRLIYDKQTMELILPSFMKGMTINTYLDKLPVEDKKMLLLDNLFATHGKMANVLRRRALTLIQSIPSTQAKEKAMLARAFKPFFIDAPITDLYPLYGGIEQKLSKEAILKQAKLELLNKWKLTAGKTHGYAIELNTIETELENIITQNLPNCIDEFEGSAHLMSTEQHVQHQVLKETLIEHQLLQQKYNPHLTEENEIDWSRTYGNPFTNRSYFKNVAVLLNDICSISDEQTRFSSRLSVSKNYALVYQRQTQFLDGFLKPVFLVWYYMDNKGNMHAMIVTPQELKSLKPMIERHLSDSWVSTTEDTVVAGHRPDGTLQVSQYRSLKEQVRFFNGEFSSLLKQETPLIWLKNSPMEKLQFFQDHLMAYRPESSNGLQQLRQALSRSNLTGYQYIAQHPLDDLTHFNWSSIAPGITNIQITELNAMAEAFKLINSRWQHKPPLTKYLAQKFHLPINSLTYIDTHLCDLIALKQILNKLPSTPLLAQLTPEKQKAVEKLLGISVSAILEQYKITPNQDLTSNAPNIQLAEIFILMRLFECKAVYQYQDIQERLKQIILSAKTQDIFQALIKTTSLKGTLLESIVNSPISNSDLLTKLVVHQDNIPFDLMDKIANKTDSIELAIALINRKETSYQIIITLLKKVHFSEKDLLIILKKADRHVLSAMLITQKLSKAVIIELNQHPSFSSSLITPVLENCQLYNLDNISELIKTIEDIDVNAMHRLAHSEHINKDILNAIVVHSKADVHTLNKVIEHPKFCHETAQIMVNKSKLTPSVYSKIGFHIAQKIRPPSNQQQDPWNTLFLKLMTMCGDDEERRSCVLRMLHTKSFHFSSDTLIYALEHYGNHGFTHRVVAQVIASLQSPKQIDMCIALKRPYNQEELMAFTQHHLTEEQIDSLLDRPDMTSEVADQLFRKSTFSKTIKDWPWLKTRHLNHIISETSDFDSLYTAIHHHHLSQPKIKAYISKARQVLFEKEKELVGQQEPGSQFEITLAKLRLKVCSHALKSLNQADYYDAAQTALTLHNTLKKALEHYQNPENKHSDKKAVFKEQCVNAIATATPKLSEHRGYKQLLTDIVNALLTLLTFGLRTMITNDWRFFKANTDSINHIEEIKTELVAV